ncbi:MAG: serine hydrolase [Gammaproteobacteria bacterium]|nr:serine hydrolase [Gammaproteobacteria bacterium]MBU1416159.1 serine hydrolase [Gammaproteobacteria bacterium]
MYPRLAVLFVSSLLFLASCATPPPVAEHLERGDYRFAQRYLTWLIEKEMSKNDITGLSIALVDDQRVVWQAGFGYAELEKGVPAAPETVYRAGSIAKLFTASAIMQLAEQGRIDIDKPLNDALPEFSIKSRFVHADPVTPRNVMSHHSGLPSNYLLDLYVRDPSPHFEVVLDGLRDEYLAFPPNKVFSYSNAGMAVLGTAVQRLSGEPFADYMTRHFFEPLRMTHSSFAARPVARTYEKNREVEPYSLRDMPAAGLLSNVVDLSQFIKMQFAEGKSGERQILSAASVDEMLRAQNSRAPFAFDSLVGLGWMLHGIQVPGGGPVASHGGSLPDSHSMLAILPEHKLGVVVLTNSGSSHTTVSKIAGEALRLMLAAQTGMPAVEPSLAAVSPERAPTAEELRQFSGYFDTMVGLAKLSTESGNIDVDAAGHHFRLVAHEDGLFTLEYKLFGLLAVRVHEFDDIRMSLVGIDGQQVIAGRIGGETMLFGEKLKPTHFPERFRRYLGAYEMIDHIDGPSPESVVLKEGDGILIGEARFSEVPDILLRIGFMPVSDTEVVTAGLGTSRGDTVRFFSVGDELRLTYSGIRMRKIN